MSSSLQIILLSRDRPNYLREALQSALSQSGERIEVIVSDNSESEEVSRMLATEFPNVLCIRRKPTLSAFEHFRAVINTATADSLVMFHDDDVMLDGYVSTLRNCLDADPTLAAVCCDALIMREGKTTKERFGMGRRIDHRILLPEELIREYFSLSPKGPAPFPGYMYRRTLIQGLYLDPFQGGKYSDVSFLLKVLQRGSFIWINKPLLKYRVHSRNDSGSESVGQRLRLLRYIYNTSKLSRKHSFIYSYRFKFWINWLRSSDANKYAWRKKVVMRYVLMRTAVYVMTDRNIWIWLLIWFVRLKSKFINRFPINFIKLKWPY